MAKVKAPKATNEVKAPKVTDAPTQDVPEQDEELTADEKIQAKSPKVAKKPAFKKGLPDPVEAHKLVEAGRTQSTDEQKKNVEDTINAIKTRRARMAKEAGKGK